MGDREGWVNLYGKDGKYQGRYHPTEGKLLISARGGHTLHDLTRYQPTNQTKPQGIYLQKQEVALQSS